jgi:putative aminopeptidase FrvX
MEARAFEFFRSLSECFGPSGFEGDAVRAVRDYVAPFAESLAADRLGSLHFTRQGPPGGPVVLLPGHVDEIGFVISGITEKGFLTFNPLGGWFDQVLLGQGVRIRTIAGALIPGVIASRPPHIIPADERGKVVTKDKMFIDVGCSNEREAREMGIRIGDPAVPESRFFTIEKSVFRKAPGTAEEKNLGKTLIACGKAFDDRIGAFVACEVVRGLAERGDRHPNTVVGAATVMEEVGARGARTSAHLVEPDVCLTLEVDVAGDVPGIEPQDAPSRMGAGPSVITFDASMIPNPGLKELVIRTAEEKGIPYQLSQMRGGGTDAGAVHTVKAGCPSIVIGVPTRHIHSHIAMASVEDVDSCVRLVTEVILRLDRKTVDSFTARP